MLEFFQSILPPESQGLRCATIFRGERRWNEHFQTNAELVEAIKRYDQAGLTVYHACASFRTSKSRKTENVAFIKSLWLDIDVGPDKAYQSIETARAGLDDFCGRLRLPEPSFIVSSGSGLHVYWCFDTAIPYEKWARYARSLKRRCAALGLCCDPARTADASSILRPPGTTNRKRAVGVLVAAEGTGQLHGVEQFEVLIDGTQEAKTIKDDGAHLKDRKKAAGSISVDDNGGYPLGQLQPIVQGCAQFRQFHDTGGQVSEPIWRACLSVLLTVDGGTQLAHTLSSGDDRYTEKRTDDYLERLGKLDGPLGCNYFNDNNPGVCTSCQWWKRIKNPAMLGHVRQPDIAPIVVAEETLPQPPRHFAYEGDDNSLVFQQGRDAQGKHLPVTITQYPLYVDMVSEGESKLDHSLTFKHHIPAKGWDTLTIKQSELWGPNGLRVLHDHGVVVHERDLFHKFVRHSIDEHHKRKLHVRYDQYGWKLNGFLFNKLYVPDGQVLEVPISEELQIRNRWIGPGVGTKGNPAAGLERWKNAANKLFAAGCEAQSVAMLCGFGAPLMHFIGIHDEGGAILSLACASSKGKTVALEGAASVWGLVKGLRLINEDNRITKYLTLAAMGHLPVIYDEIDTRDPVFVRQLVQNFTVGRDKMRANTSGQIEHRLSEWQTIMLTAGNASLVDALAQGNEADAMAYRVLELQTDIPEYLKDVLGEKLRVELELNSGFAGDIYARYLAANPEQIRGLMEQVRDMWHAKLRLPEKYRFWRRLLSCVTVAGVLVRHLNLLDLSIDRINLWLYNTVMEKAGGPVAARDMEWQTRELAAFVASMAAHTLTVAGTWEKNKAMRPITTPRDGVLARYETGSKRFTVSVTEIKRYAGERALAWEEWRKWLTEKGIIGEMKKITLVAGTEIAGAQLRCYEIDLNHPLMTENVTMPSADLTSNVVALRPK